MELKSRFLYLIFMSRGALLVFLSIFLTAESTWAQGVLRNLIPNPSFEYTGAGTVRERPDESWTFTASDERVTGHATTSRSLDGFRSYLIRAEEGRGYLTSDTFELDRRREYRFSFGVCGDGFIEPEIIWWRQENDTLSIHDNVNFNTISTSDEWQIIQFVVSSPRRVSAASVRFTVFDGYVWIDDVRFR